MTLFKSLLTIACLSSTGTGVAHAADGDLDPQFGIGGTAYVQYAGQPSNSSDLQPAADGGWYVSGVVDTSEVVDAQAQDGPKSLPLLTKFKADGSIDAAFGLNGSILGPSIDANTITVLLRDKVRLYQVVSDRFVDGAPRRVHVIAYFLDGRIDTAYGTGDVAAGVATIDGNAVNVRFDAALQNGRVIVAGTARAPGSNFDAFMLARLTAKGRLDTTFAEGGRALYTLQTGAGAANRFTGLSVLPDGRLLAAGRARAASDSTVIKPYSMVAARLSVNGVLDAAYGAGGFAITKVLSGNNYGLRALPTADGGVLLGGSTCLPLDPDTNDETCYGGVRRLHPDGSVDTAYSGDGHLLLNANWPQGKSQDTYVYDMTLDFQGRLLVTGGIGWTDAAGTLRGAGYVLKANADGTLDSGWGTNGLARFASPDADRALSSTRVVRRVDGSERVIAVGNHVAPQTPGSGVVAQFLD